MFPTESTESSDFFHAKSPLCPSFQPPRRSGARRISLASLLEGGAPKGRKESPHFSLLFGYEQALSWLSGLPQKSHGEFCGKRSGRHIRSCGKRSAPQTTTPCRDEVGSLTACKLGNGTLSVPFQGSRADAKQMRGKRRRKPSGQAARNAAADLKALRRRERGHYRARSCRAQRD